MDPLLAALAAAGVLVGATGTWSPCGFSMIETIGPTGHTGGLRTTLAAAATFAPFALLGGSITFLLLALLGGLLGGSGPAGYVLAAALAIAAAAAEARGLRIVPQVRRQLPVAWRSRLPMPLAAAGYGVLLGLGFTTFVLSYGVWALMGIVLLVADPLAGLVVGIAFGVGRALPIVLLAPLADRPVGERACEAMAMRPGLYRGARLGDAAALALVATVLIGGAGAEAARTEVPRASDPSAAGPALVYERSDGRGELRDADGGSERLEGSDPATGGPWVALARKGRISILDRETMDVAGSVPAAGVDAIAVTRGWVAYRVHRRHRDRLLVTELDAGGAPVATRKLAKVKRPRQLSRPSIEGDRLVVAVARSGRNELVRYELRGDRRPRRRTLIASRTAALTGPSIAGKKIAYVRTTARRQTLRIKGSGGGKGRAVYRRRSGPPTLWTTAISGNRVLVTLVRRGGGSKIISVPR